MVLRSGEERAEKGKKVDRFLPQTKRIKKELSDKEKKVNGPVEGGAKE